MKQYNFAGLDIAMQLLRPNATYEMSGLEIIRWDDPRPVPTLEELVDMIEKIKNFEDSNVMIVVNKDGEMETVDAQEFMEEYANKLST